MAGSSSTLSTQDAERRTLILMQMRGAPRTDPSPACLCRCCCCCYAQGTFIYVWEEYYIKFCLSSTVIYIPLIHEDVNNWSPPELASAALFVDISAAPEGSRGPCGLWSWFHICPSGQMLRSRSFRNHANTLPSAKCTSSSVKALEDKLEGYTVT